MIRVDRTRDGLARALWGLGWEWTLQDGRVYLRRDSTGNWSPARGDLIAVILRRLGRMFIDRATGEALVLSEEEFAALLAA